MNRVSALKTPMRMTEHTPDSISDSLDFHPDEVARGEGQFILPTAIRSGVPQDSRRNW
jgi:hypothetical protein